MNDWISTTDATCASADKATLGKPVKWGTLPCASGGNKDSCN
jgi:hypothetical protein